MLGPILDGPHVRLGPPQPEHLTAFTRWFADIGVTQYLLLRNPPSLKQEEDWLEKMAASEHDVVWAITLQGTGALNATEAIRLRTQKILTSVYSGNEASRRALEKVGYREWHDEWLGEILREEWKD